MELLLPVKNVPFPCQGMADIFVVVTLISSFLPLFSVLHNHPCMYNSNNAIITNTSLEMQHDEHSFHFDRLIHWSNTSVDYQTIFERDQLHWTWLVSSHWRRGQNTNELEDFQRLKADVPSEQLNAMYEPENEATVSADASSCRASNWTLLELSLIHIWRCRRS